MQALAIWQWRWRQPTSARAFTHHLDGQISAAIDRGLAYLESQQREDGSFVALAFGNELQADETNPVCGTAQVLAACYDLELLESPLAKKAASWLLSAQHADGGWGPPRVPLDYSGSYRTGARTWRENDVLAQYCTIEETAQTVSALLPLLNVNQAYAHAVAKGLHWIADAIEQDRHHRPAVVGWCFAGLWYHERLFPLIFSARALSLAVDRVALVRSVTAPLG
jgi:squalene-hopene/tetraprenyl-beta-curcumene cyclase